MLIKWIVFKDRTSNARLKRGEMGDTKYLWIVGLPNTNPRFQQAIDKLGFTATPNGKALQRRMGPADASLRASHFHSVWPEAALGHVDDSQVNVFLDKPAPAPASLEVKKESDEDRQLRIEISNARRLGRNADGFEVYQGSAGRFIYREQHGVVRESQALKPAMYLYADDEASLDLCADGFVISMLKGEVQREKDFGRFMSAVNAGPNDPQITRFPLAMRDAAHDAIDAAVVRFLTRQHATPNDAYGDANRLYDYLPAYKGPTRGKGAMPLPLSVIAQRLLGDTTDKTVVLPNAFDGASFAFLAPGTHIRAFKGTRDLSARAQGLQREGLTWLDEFHHARESNADAMFFNADPKLGSDGLRSDYKDALLAVRSLSPGGRAVLVLAADDAERPGDLGTQGRHFIERLYRNYDVEDAFDVGREMTSRVGTDAALRLVTLRNRAPAPDVAVPQQLPVCHSWDEIKFRVDESLSRAAIREQESGGIDLGKAYAENKLQRPYIAFSKVGEATTMVPKELQAPLQAYFSELEAREGPIDRYVEKELRLGENTLSKSFSPEQVDTAAMCISRFKRGRGIIVGHDTGIGKGRIIAAAMTWALKQRKTVVFITDGAHLFSDIARDLRDIGEWGRVSPLVMNADGLIVDNIGDAGVLVEGTKVAEMRRILANNVTLRTLGVNVVFTTYSQIFSAESEKARWLKDQLKDSLLITDESHVAAGSDSNIATQIAEMTQSAWNVLYSSGSWLKTFENLHIYARAFPESVNVATLAETMRRGGAAFSEVFSTMMAREGAFVRCEHDLSKLEISVEVDEPNKARNVMVSDQVSEIMGMISYASGDLKRLVMRASDINVATLRDARDARQNGHRTSVFKSRFGTGSMLYQVHRRVNAALNVDNAVRLAIEGIAAGRKPVIVFEDTGEAFVKQALLRQAVSGPGGKLVLPNTVEPPTIRDLMLRMLDSLKMVRVEDVGVEDLPYLGVEEVDEETNERDGNAEAEDGLQAVVTESDGIDVPAEVEAAMRERRENGTGEGDAALLDDETPVKKRRVVKWKMVPFWEVADLPQEDAENFRKGIVEIERKIQTMADIPLNAPDEIGRRIREQGIRVGELSGRSFELRPLEQPGEYAAGTPRDSRQKSRICQVVPRVKGKAFVNATVRQFNGGELDALMINRSVATGISLHASPRFADQRRRQLTEMQIPENVTDRAQLFGRVNRFDQLSFPLIQTATTGNLGEQRQIMVQNKKLADMSANVRSSRDNYAIIKDVPDLLNSIGREVCRLYLMENPEVLSRLDISPAILEDKSRDFASLLTSRIPLLASVQQEPTYEQLYALFDDAVLQAELAGEDPLKPNELDVRATVSGRKLLFGFDHKGLGSAFDGAVFAERLDWKEDVRPLPLEAIVATVEANRSRLLASGRAAKIGERANGEPVIDLSPGAERMLRMADVQMRTSIINTERKFRSVDEAMAAAAAALANPAIRMDPALKSMVKLRDRNNWLKEYLPRLVPGCMVETIEDKAYRRAVVLDIVPPTEDRDLAKLVRWRVLTIAPGESRARNSSLRALMGEIVAESGGQAPAGGIPPVEYRSRRLAIGGDFLETAERCAVELQKDPAEMTSLQRRWGRLSNIPGGEFYARFQRSFAGVRERSALVLTGNMYLASEWAAQTKAGKGTIFTDDRGLRQRGILLESKFKPEWLRYLPARLWTKPMLHQFVDRLVTGEIPDQVRGGAFKVFTSFNAAWKSTEGSSQGNLGTLHIAPGMGLVMNVGVKARSRINGLLRQAQKKIKEEVFEGVKVRPADDPGHVTLKERDTKASRARRTRGEAEKPGAVTALSRKEADLVVLQAETPAKMQRALEMMIRGPGLEIFVPGNSPLASIAKECVRDYFVEQLRKDAADDPARAARLEERLAEDAQGEVPNTEGAEDELRALFESLREEDAVDQRDAQDGLDFAGGVRTEAPRPEAATVQGQNVGPLADTQPEIDVAALLARPPRPAREDAGAGATGEVPPPPATRSTRPQLAA